MNPANSARSLRRLAVMLSVLLLGFVLLFGWSAWRAERADQIAQMRTALEIGEKALDRYFVLVEAGLHELALDLMETGEMAATARLQQRLQRFAELHPEAASVSLATLGGQVLASTVASKSGGFPNVSGEPSFQAYLATLPSNKRMDLGRPLYGPVSQQWIFPLRFAVRDGAGQAVAIINASVPVEVLETFWREAPLFKTSAIGLLRDDGFLLSRYPQPANSAPHDTYGKPRSGALAREIQAGSFPDKGYVEGVSQLTGEEHGNVYRRLENYPVTLFVSVPVAEFRAAWWQRVHVPYLLIAVLGGAAALGYRYTLRNAQDWTTERRRTEAYLRASEEEQRFLIDHLLAGVVVHDTAGLVLRANAHALVLFGLTLEQMMGRAVIDPAWSFVREDGSDMPVDDYPVSRVLRSGESLRGIVIGVRRPDAREPVWLLGDAYPEFNDEQQLRRVVVTFVDISERRRTEKTLARSESRYRMMVSNVDDGLLQTRPDGTILSANPAACQIFGLSEEALRERGRSGLVDLTDPRLPLLLAQREREGQARGLLTMLRGDGTPFEAEISSMLYADERGEQVSSMVVRDVTNRRRVEAALAAQELAERANRAKSEFMARMSHELRTPLNAILGFSEVLELDTEHPLHASQRQRLLLIRQAGDHLLALINELLDLSRIESGTMHLQMRDIDVAELARQVMDEVAAQARERGVELMLDLPAAATRPVRADRRRMRQVLLNLVSNGIKYNAVGGLVSLSVRDSDDGADTAGGGGGGGGVGLLICVRDTGVGMNEEQVASLFEPFNRLGREESEVEGTGIGLVITRGLVELMDGRIEVRSEPGAGTEFRVHLPPAAAYEPASDEQAAGAAGARSGQAVSGRVLYIDDDDVNRVLMQAFFDLRPGVRLSLASDGASGLALARQTRPDLMLIDLMMPGMDGLQVLQALREDATLRHTPCLAVSANAMPHEIEEALGAGFDGYLTKPVSTPVLLAEVDRILTAGAAAITGAGAASPQQRPGPGGRPARAGRRPTPR